MGRWGRCRRRRPLPLFCLFLCCRLDLLRFRKRRRSFPPHRRLPDWRWFPRYRPPFPRRRPRRPWPRLCRPASLRSGDLSIPCSRRPPRERRAKAASSQPSAYLVRATAPAKRVRQNSVERERAAWRRARARGVVACRSNTFRMTPSRSATGNPAASSRAPRFAAGHSHGQRAVLARRGSGSFALAVAEPIGMPRPADVRRAIVRRYATASACQVSMNSP